MRHLHSLTCNSCGAAPGNLTKPFQGRKPVTIILHDQTFDQITQCAGCKNDIRLTHEGQPITELPPLDALKDAGVEIVRA